jgi:DHA2 family methylenomycin A resistance protein-like MFS transporter
LVGFLLNLTLYGTVFVLGIYLQRIHRWSPSASGLALLPFAVTIFAANIVSGRLVSITGVRAIMTVGLALAAFGTWRLRGIDATTPYGAMLPGLILLPFGIGLAVPVMTSSLLATVPRARAGVASGVLNSVRQAGGAIGVALFGALMAGTASGMRHALVAGTILLGGAAAVAAGSIGTGGSALPAAVSRRQELRSHG